MKLLPLLASIALQGCASAAVAPPPPVVVPEGRPVMTLTRSGQMHAREPLWVLQMGDKAVWVVSGRASRQQDDLRHISGTKSPLPPGRYRVHAPEQILPDDPIELGRSGWIALTPQFVTGRSALGIHHDPSFGLPNGESGTDGCIGTLNADDMRMVMRWVQQNRPQTLIVEN